MNVGKYQKDFEYIFSDIKIAGYIRNIDDTDRLDWISNYKDSFVIICDDKEKTEGS